MIGSLAGLLGPQPGVVTMSAALLFNTRGLKVEQQQCASAKRPTRSPHRHSLSRCFHLLPNEYAPLHPLIRPIAHYSPLRDNLKTITFDLEETCLLCTDPFWVSGGINCGHPFVALEAIFSRVGHHIIEKVGALLNCGGWLSPALNQLRKSIPGTIASTGKARTAQGRRAAARIQKSAAPRCRDKRSRFAINRL